MVTAGCVSLGRPCGSSSTGSAKHSFIEAHTAALEAVAQREVVAKIDRAQEAGLQFDLGLGRARLVSHREI